MNKKQARPMRAADGVWALEMETVRAFLVTGESGAVLIDTGAGGVDIAAAVASCTSLPVRVVNTHAHYDHISGNSAFDMQFVHPLEMSLLQKAGFSPRPIGDGFGLDLGGRILQVVTLPGHSPGGIGLWDSDAGLLFAGDTVLRGQPVLLCLDGSSLEAYARSLDRILSLETSDHGCLSRVFCAHAEMEVGIDAVHDLKTLVTRVIAGETEKEALPEPYRARFQETYGLYRFGDVAVLAS